MKNKQYWIDDDNFVIISQNTLEDIGVNISECELCMKAHRAAIPHKKSTVDWKINSKNESMIAHVKQVRSFGRHH